jgi:hypothetical protein
MLILDLSDPQTFNQKLSEFQKRINTEVARKGLVDLPKIIREHNEAEKEKGAPEPAK